MKPLLHGAIEENPRGQVRVYNADGKLLIGTTCRGYLAELAESVKEAKAEALLTMADRLENARDMTWNGSMRKVNGWASAADFLRQHSEQAGNQS